MDILATRNSRREVIERTRIGLLFATLMGIGAFYGYQQGIDAEQGNNVAATETAGDLEDCLDFVLSHDGSTIYFDLLSEEQKSECELPEDINLSADVGEPTVGIVSSSIEVSLPSQAVVEARIDEEKADASDTNNTIIFVNTGFWALVGCGYGVFVWSVIDREAF